MASRIPFYWAFAIFSIHFVFITFNIFVMDLSSAENRFEIQYVLYDKSNKICALSFHFAWLCCALSLFGVAFSIRTISKLNWLTKNEKEKLGEHQKVSGSCYSIYPLISYLLFKRNARPIFCVFITEMSVWRLGKYSVIAVLSTSSSCTPHSHKQLNGI